MFNKCFDLFFQVCLIDLSLLGIHTSVQTGCIELNNNGGYKHPKTNEIQIK